MTAILIKSKKRSPLINAIADFAKEMDLDVEILSSIKQAEIVLKRKKKPVKSFAGILDNPNPPDLKEIRQKKMSLIPRDKSLSVESMAGMFKTKNPPSIEEIREKMWKKI